MNRLYASALVVLLASPGVAAAAGAGIGRSGHVVAPRHGWMSRDANDKDAWLYVAGYNNSVISIYDLDEPGTPLIGSITDGITNPDGITLDAKGTLYVPDSTAGRVTVYPAGATQPSLVIDTGQRAQCAAVDRTGDVYVCVRGNMPGIAVYARGRTTPKRFITSSLVQIPNEIVFDKAGTLYIVDDNMGVSILPPGPSGNVTSLALSGLMNGSTSGIALDAKTGSFYISFAQSPPTSLLEYLPGQQTPERSIPIDFGSTDFMTAGLWNGKVKVFAPNSQSDSVYIFNATLQGTPKELVTASQSVQGVAFKPAGVP